MAGTLDSYDLFPLPPSSQMANANNGHGHGPGLSPRPLYDYPSPTSNYPSGMGGASPAFFPMAYKETPRFGSSVFLPPPDVFAEARKESATDASASSPREAQPRRLDGTIRHDPVAMHLLVETAMGDSQHFEVLSVEEVEALKQEQRALDGRLVPARKKLESETKIRDAARSLSRLSVRKEKGHRRGTSSQASNAVKELTDLPEDEELRMSEQKVEDLTRELIGIESRMRAIDMQLLMHTAGVLQLTHNGPSKQSQAQQLPNGTVQRPDSPTSIITYDTGTRRHSQKDEFDERSFYRSPENLDSLMEALQKGTHNHPERSDQHSDALAASARRIEELNTKLREYIIQANPERNRDYSLPPRVAGETADPSALGQQLTFLDQGLQDINVEFSKSRSTAKETLGAMEGRLDGLNNQLYAMLSKSDENAQPPPSTVDGGFQAQLDYLEDSFYNIQQVQYSMDEQLEELRSQVKSKSDQLDQVQLKASDNQDSQYEATLTGLWSIMQAGEEEARRQKQQRRELLASDPDADEEVSPDEDFTPNEPFSLNAFSSKVQMLYSRASSLKQKQSILVRQIKQQRELNSRSDAQREEQFDALREQVLSARSEKMSMEKELERAIDQLRSFDEQKHEDETKALKEARERIESLEALLTQARDDAQINATALQAELSQSASRIEDLTQALARMTEEKEAAEARTAAATKALDEKEAELRHLETDLVRLTTEVTLAKAELDGAYGTRAERAAESGAPLRTQLEELTQRNASLLSELESLRSLLDAASHSEAEARDVEKRAKQELADMAADYEALTRDAIQSEKEREGMEAAIDRLRDEKEGLELELSDERVRWLGVRSPMPTPNGAGPGAGVEATSIRMLREDFRKMMRERTAEGLRALRNEQEERRKLEAMVRSLRKEAAPMRSNLSKQMMA